MDQADPAGRPATTVAGVDFVDILFALVVAEILTPLRHPKEILSVGYAHLGVAAVLTLASWVGYHHSSNRADRKFRLLPNDRVMWLFVLDIAMVVLYWLAAAQAEVLDHEARFVPTASARPESWIVVASFVLYALWDALSAWEKAGDRRVLTRLTSRRWLTISCLVIGLAIAIVVELVDPTHGVAIVAADTVLVALLLGYRVAKELAG